MKPRNITTIEDISGKATSTNRAQRGYIIADKESINEKLKNAFNHNGEWMEIITVYPRKTMGNTVKSGGFIPIRFPIKI